MTRSMIQRRHTDQVEVDESWCSIAIYRFCRLFFCVCCFRSAHCELIHQRIQSIDSSPIVTSTTGMNQQHRERSDTDDGAHSLSLYLSCCHCALDWCILVLVFPVVVASVFCLVHAINAAPSASEQLTPIQPNTPSQPQPSVECAPVVFE